MRGWNKKAAFIEGAKIWYYLAFLVVLAPFIFFFSGSITGFALSQNPLPEKLDIDIAANRIINICFAYKDEKTGMVEPGIIDINKLNAESLRNCFKIGDKYDPLEVQFISNDNIFSGENIVILQTVGRTFYQEEKRNVLIRKNEEEIYSSVLTIRK